jgi:predicted nucleotidyltransferase
VQPPGFAPVTEEALQEIVHRLVTGLHPHKIVLFGSYVYGTPTADSDVDLLVKTPAEVTQALDRGDAFMREIMARGRVLYERSD